jgi:hypothetical protein
VGQQEEPQGQGGSLDEQLDLLEAVDRRITSEHVETRLRELRDRVGTASEPADRPARPVVPSLAGPWGRIDASGTFYVRTSSGERAIGARPGDTAKQAAAFFRRRFQRLETEISLLEERLLDEDIPPEEAQAAARRLLASVASADALGDLEQLRSRVERLELATRNVVGPLAAESHQGINFYTSLGAAERQAFLRQATERTFARGARLMSEGESGDCVMVILEGRTLITVDGSDGVRVIAERGPGQLVGERGVLRQKPRSASVVADELVRVLVMTTDDFVSFVVAYPAVLDLVEKQIYDRLSEDPEAYAQDGWPSGSLLQTVTPALGGSLRPRPLAGENCTVILTDVVGFGSRHRNDRDRRIIRRESWEMMRRSMGSLWNSCFSEDRGDGLLVVAPPHVPTMKIMEFVNRELPGRLQLHNRTYAESVNMKLRIAINVGPVTGDNLGLSGEAITRAARLLDAPALKHAMRDTGQGLGIIVSEYVYDTVVGDAPQYLGAGRYQRVAVENKEFRGSAWMQLGATSAEAPPRAVH